MFYFADLLQGDLQHHRTLNDILNNELVQIIITVGVIIVLRFILRDAIARIIRRTVRRHHYNSETEAKKRETTVTKVCQTAISGVLWIIGGIFILGLLHVNIAALATGAGLVSVVVGLSAQNTIKDFLSGIFIIIENQYAVGDIISVQTSGGFTVWGVVEDLTIRITKLRDLDGAQHVITNGAAQIISNNTASYSNVEVSVRVSYTADIDKVKRIVNEIGQDMTKDETWSKCIIEPIKFWRTNSFDDYAVSVLIIGKVKPGSQYDMAGAIRERVLKAFKANHIDIPTAQVVAKPQA